MSTRSLPLLLSLSVFGTGAGLHLQVGQNCTEAQLSALLASFTTGDERLVVATPHGNSTEQADAAALAMVECSMDPLQHPETHSVGGALVEALARTNLNDRVALGNSHPVLTQLATLVNYSGHFKTVDDIIIRGAENAAEAIWILSDTSGTSNPAAANVHGFLATTPVASDLAGMLERDRDEDDAMTPKGRMWAAAALGNLMAEYNNDTINYYTLQVRGAMATRPNFTRLLLNLTETGTVPAGTPPEEMPGTASRTEESRNYRYIYGWAAMQALGNLALVGRVRDELLADSAAKAIICGLVSSPDYLEQSQAQRIVTNVYGTCGARSVVGQAA